LASRRLRAMADELNDKLRRNKGWDNLKPAKKGEPSRNPKGRPKNGFCLTEELRKLLKEKVEGENFTNMARLAKATFEDAIKTDGSSRKIVWDRIDGPISLVLENSDKGGGVFKIEYVPEKGDGDKG